jgi:hypothetical protein
MVLTPRLDVMIPSSNLSLTILILFEQGRLQRELENDNCSPSCLVRKNNNDDNKELIKTLYLHNSLQHTNSPLTLARRDLSHCYFDLRRKVHLSEKPGDLEVEQ